VLLPLPAYGPLFEEESHKTHGELCDVTSALEKGLADAMVWLAMMSSTKFIAVPLGRLTFVAVVLHSLLISTSFRPSMRQQRRVNPQLRPKSKEATGEQLWLP